MDIASNYGLFLAKAITLVVVVGIPLILMVALSHKEKGKKGRLVIRKINDHYKNLANTLKQHTLPPKAFKQILKEAKAAEKATRKQHESKKPDKHVFVVPFKGDIKASSVKALREVITGLITVASPSDEVVLKLNSPGGLVHSYGLAASQLQRLKRHNIPLTICVDKVAASGGYMMACVADWLIAAPFAIIGSIGVVAQLPNFHRFLKKHDIDFEQITAGEYKRTLSVFGKNTDKGRKKFQTNVETIHQLFKDFIAEHRPNLDLNKVATGEYWQATQALDLGLVDQLLTSDDYLYQASQKYPVYEVTYEIKQSLSDRLGLVTQKLLQHVVYTAKSEEHLTEHFY